MSKLLTFWLLMLLTLPLFIQGIFDHPLWMNDEGHVAEIGREMFLSGDVVVPRLGGEPFVEKPPLYFIVMSICYRWLGVTPGAARLPSAIFGFLTVLVVYGIGAAQGRYRQGLLAAFLLATTLLMFRFAHWCVVDSAVCFFMAFSFYAFLRAYQAVVGKIWWYLACYTACALAFMSKGLIVPVMMGAAAVSFLIWDGNLRELRRMGLWAGLPLFALIIGPWLYLLWDVGGTELFKNFLIENNLGRFCATISSRYTEHTRGFFYYFIDFPGNFLPWTPFFLPALVWALKQARDRQSAGRSFYRFLLAGFFVNLLLVSCSSTKRGVYILPLYPLATLMIGGWLDELLAGRSPLKWERVFLWLQALTICAFPLALVIAGFHMELASLPVLTALGAISVGLSVAAVRALWRGCLRSVVANLGVQTVLIYTLVVWLIFPVISPYKHYTQFFECVAEVVQPGDTVLVFANIHESNLGQMCITLNRFVPVIWDRQKLVSMLTQQRRRVFIFVEEWDYRKVAHLLPPDVGIFCSKPMFDPIGRCQKPILRCITNLAGAQRLALFQPIEKPAVPTSKPWKAP